MYVKFDDRTVTESEASYFGTYSQDAWLLAALKQAGLGTNDVERINTRPPSLVSVIDTGGVDAIVGWEPFVFRTSLSRNLEPGAKHEGWGRDGRPCRCVRTRPCAGSVRERACRTSAGRRLCSRTARSTSER